MSVHRLFRTNALTRAAATALGAGLVALAAGSAHAAVGARVLLQQWSPQTPEQQSVLILVNEPTVVSDAVQQAWSQARPLICAQLTAAMGRQGAAAGQTLYDIKCLLSPTATFSVSSAGKNALAVRLAVSGYVEASSTTPVPGSFADPRVSLALTGEMQLAMTVQADPNQTLHFEQAAFSLSGAKLDSHNAVADVVKFVADDLVPFFGGPNYKRMAENAINGVGMNVAGQFNNAVAPINAKLRGPSGAVRVGLWAKSDAIVVAFGPRELTPPTGGTMSGVFHASAKTPVSSKAQAPDCGSMVITASVQTGPAPLLDPNGALGEAPVRQVGSFSAQPGAAGECRYRVTNLAAGWPNQLQTRNCKGLRYALRGEGWDGDVVKPNPAVERNFVMETPTECVDAALLHNNQPYGKVQPDDPGVRFGQQAQVLVQASSLKAPAVNPAGTGTLNKAAFTQPALAALNPQPLPPKASPTGSLAALNPQPLPPKASPAGSLAALNPQPLPPRSAPGQAATLNWGAAPR
jgi:hypothetical protein